MNRIHRWVLTDMEHDMARWERMAEPWIMAFIGLAVGYFLGVAIFG
jgi:type II secretory pathway component PulF